MVTELMVSSDVTKYQFIIRIKGRLNRYYPSSLVGSSIIRIGHRLDNRIFPTLRNI